jgi:hypothetical protein
MGHDFASVARLGARQHGAVSARQLDLVGISPQLRSKWVQRQLLIRAGPRSFYLAGSEPTWRREVLLQRDHRGCRLPYVTRSTSVPLGIADTVMIDGIHCLTAHRLIVESPLFALTLAETENAIDSPSERGECTNRSFARTSLPAIRRGVSGGRQLREAPGRHGRREPTGAMVPQPLPSRGCGAAGDARDLPGRWRIRRPPRRQLSRPARRRARGSIAVPSPSTSRHRPALLAAQRPAPAQIADCNSA